MPDRNRHRIKMKICGGGPASHIDQGRHTARVLQRPEFAHKWTAHSF
jgi:hypothetical protein